MERLKFKSLYYLFTKTGNPHKMSSTVIYNYILFSNYYKSYIIIITMILYYTNLNQQNIYKY